MRKHVITKWNTLGVEFTVMLKMIGGVYCFFLHYKLLSFRKFKTQWKIYSDICFVHEYSPISLQYLLQYTSELVKDGLKSSYWYVNNLFTFCEISLVNGVSPSKPIAELMISLSMSCAQLQFVHITVNSTSINTSDVLGHLNFSLWEIAITVWFTCIHTNDKIRVNINCRHILVYGFSNH